MQVFNGPAHSGPDRKKSIRGFFKGPLGVAGALMGLGVCWSAAGVLLTPTMKFYNWLLIAFIYLPCLYLLVRKPRAFVTVLGERRDFQLYLVLFCCALASLGWSSGVERYLVTIKREFFFLLLVFAWVIWGRANRASLYTMCVGLGGLAGFYSLVALISYGWGETGRIQGFGGFLDNPNPAGYAISFLLVLSCSWWPRSVLARLGWAFLHVCSVMFVVLTGSRGALLAMLVVALAMMILGNSRLFRVVALLVVLAAVTLVAVEPSLLQRGDSLRLALADQALEHIRLHPWLGQGLGTDFELTAGQEVFIHPHNFVLDTLMRFGIPISLLWLWLWAWTGWNAWKHRAQALGFIVLMGWIYASVAQQFDVFAAFGRSRAMWLVIWVPILLSFCLERDRLKPREPALP